jgi:diaminopimelate decarboxylase
VTPHYAVKSNNDGQLLQWLHQAGAHFDCASPQEIRDVKAIGAPATNIIYANPCKSREDIQSAMQLGASTTVVDSPEEVQKLSEAGFRADGHGVLIRLKVPDAASAQPFSRKFGAPLEWVPDILHALRAAKLCHAGWSFHVGSLCSQPKQFSGAIELCAEADAIARTLRGASTATIVDIGGGFIASPDEFAAAAAEIRAARTWFAPDTRWIGEPGRFFSSPVVTLRVEVIGVKRRFRETDSAMEPAWIYTLNESVYGSFSNIPFDGQRPVYQLMSSDAAERPRVRAMLFGRTCDSADCLSDNIELPQLRVGDILDVDNMGAYTLVSASYFNGFPMPKRSYAE